MNNQPECFVISALKLFSVHSHNPYAMLLGYSVHLQAAENPIESIVCVAEIAILRKPLQRSSGEEKKYGTNERTG